MKALKPNMRECSVRLWKCDLDVRRRAGRGVPAATREPGAPTVSYDAEHIQRGCEASILGFTMEADRVVKQELDLDHVPQWRDTAAEQDTDFTERCSSFVDIKDSLEKTSIKEELEIGPTVLQLRAVPSLDVKSIKNGPADPRPGTGGCDGATSASLCGMFACSAPRTDFQDDFSGRDSGVLLNTSFMLDPKETYDTCQKVLREQSDGSGETSVGMREFTDKQHEHDCHEYSATRNRAVIRMSTHVDGKPYKYRNMHSKAYRWCAVPLCPNTSAKTPEKLFIFVPFDKTIRNKWLKHARRDFKGITPSTQLYFCEDHFDLPNDMENYMEYHVMGSVSQIRMKKGTQQSSQGSQDIIIETGHHQGQLNTRHTINVIVNNNNKRERQKRYREQNRDKLKQREAERRERIHFSQSIAGPSTSSNTNRIELNNEEIITAQSSSGLEEIQPSSIQSNDQGNEQNALQKKRERQQRYREQNRDKLKQREAERRRRLQNADVITELAASPNIEFTGIINDPIIDEISTNSQNIASLE